MNNTILEKKKRVSDQILYALIQLSSFLSIFILLVIIGYILYRGIPAFDFSYLVNTTSIINDTVGILPNIINTLYIVIVTLLIACPIGIGGAIYLNEYTKNEEKEYEFHRILLSTKYDNTTSKGIIDLTTNDQNGNEIVIKSPGFPHQIKLQKLIKIA